VADQLIVVIITDNMPQRNDLNRNCIHWWSRNTI